MARANANNVSVLRYRALNPLYDLVTQLTTRERTFKKALLEQADLQPGCEVLDVGCGTGTLTWAANESQPVARIVGLDGDCTILEIAAQKRRKQGQACAFMDGLCNDLPFATQSFDRVFCSLLLHHLQPEAKAGTRAEIRRVLRPERQLHIADWGAASGPITRALFKPVRELDGLANTVDHVEGRLPRYIVEAGFGDVRVRLDFYTVFGVLNLFSCVSDCSPWRYNLLHDCPLTQRRSGSPAHEGRLRDRTPLLCTFCLFFGSAISAAPYHLLHLAGSDQWLGTFVRRIPIDKSQGDLRPVNLYAANRYRTILNVVDWLRRKDLNLRSLGYEGNDRSGIVLVVNDLRRC